MEEQTKINFSGFCTCLENGKEIGRHIVEEYYMSLKEYFHIVDSGRQNIVEFIKVRHPNIIRIDPSFSFARDRKWEENWYKENAKIGNKKVVDIMSDKKEDESEEAPQKRPWYIKLLLFPFKLIWKIVKGIIVGIIKMLIPDFLIHF